MKTEKQRGLVMSKKNCTFASRMARDEQPFRRFYLVRGLQSKYQVI